MCIRHHSGARAYKYKGHSPGDGGRALSQDSNQTGTFVPSLPLLQFLAWVAARRRSHVETMEAWRTSCPRLSVWEDALAEDLVRVERADVALRGAAAVALTEKGAAVLKAARRAPQTGPSPPADGVVRRGGLAEDG